MVLQHTNTDTCTPLPSPVHQSENVMWLEQHQVVCQGCDCHFKSLDRSSQTSTSYGLTGFTVQVAERQFSKWHLGSPAWVSLDQKKTKSHSCFYFTRFQRPWNTDSCKLSPFLFRNLQFCNSKSFFLLFPWAWNSEKARCVYQHTGHS